MRARLTRSGLPTVCCNANPSSISRRASASLELKQPQPRSISAFATSCVRPEGRQIAMASSSSGRAALDIAAVGRKFPSGGERAGTCGAGSVRRGQRLRQGGAPFAEMRMQLPEPSQRAGQFAALADASMTCRCAMAARRLSCSRSSSSSPRLVVRPALRVGALGELPRNRRHVARRMASRSPLAVSCSSAKSRMVSSMSKRSPVLRTMLWSTSAASVSISASQTDSAASSVKPPANTASRANSVRSAGSRSS